MNRDEMERKLRGFVASQVGVPDTRILADTDIVDDLRIYGGDVWELLENFGCEFGVNMDGLRWYHHSGPEGVNLFWILRKPWWMRKTHIPIRLSDLVESVERGEWAIKYPEAEKEAEPAGGPCWSGDARGKSAVSHKAAHACLWILEAAMFGSMILLLLMDALFDARTRPDLDSIASVLGTACITSNVALALAAPFLWRTKRKLGIIAVISVAFFVLVALLMPRNM